MADGQRSRHRRTIGTVLVVLVLAGAAVGAWCYRGDELPLSGTRAGVAGKPIDRRPDGALPVAEPPGVSGYHGSLRRFSQITAMHMLTDDEHRVYTDGGATTTRVSVGKLDGATVAVIEVRLADRAAATTARRRLHALERGYGLTKRVATPAGVTAAEPPHPTENGDRLVRGHYVHGDVVVRITSRGSDHAVVLDGFHDALAAQLRVLHADA